MQPEHLQGSHQRQHRGAAASPAATAGTVCIDVPASTNPKRSSDSFTAPLFVRVTGSGRRWTRRCVTLGRRAWKEILKFQRDAHQRPVQILLFLLVVALVVLGVSVRRLQYYLAREPDFGEVGSPTWAPVSPPVWSSPTPKDADGWYRHPIASLAYLASQAPDRGRDGRTTAPRPPKEDQGGVELGEFGVEEPPLLPGVVTHYRTYTEEELLARHSDMTIIYTFVNGTDPAHAFRRAMLEACGGDIFFSTTRHFAQSTLSLLSALGDLRNNSHKTNSNNDDDDDDDDNDPLRPPPPMTSLQPWEEPDFARCFPKFLRELMPLGDAPVGTSREIMDRITQHVAPNSRDRETDELRHSFRSMEAHMRWHTGRVVVVSPGHHAQWIDSAKNFLASRCAPPSSPSPSPLRTSAAGRNTRPHVRVTTVHQDALLPYGMHLTMNSHTIEKYLWRVRNVTSVHLYFNDDYFVNRDTAITDFLNEFGGTIVRTERAVMGTGMQSRPKKVGSWSASTSFTQHFDTLELDVHREDHIPAHMTQLWAQRMAGIDYMSGRAAPAQNANDTTTTRTAATTAASAPLYSALPAASLFSRVAASTDRYVDVAIMSKTEDAPLEAEPRRNRRFSTHAPFTYCTAMHRYLSTRYEREFARTSFQHPRRHRQDLLMPFIYNAFVMARPWAASPKYLQYLFDLHTYRERLAANADANATPPPLPPVVDIYMDNNDGCAPSTMYSGPAASQCVFAKFLDDMSHNEGAVSSIRRINPLFFNINAGFSQTKPTQYLRAFLRHDFPNPSYLEGDALARNSRTAAAADDGAALRGVYESLMRLPLVLVTSYANGACPLVRSLQLSLPDHTGPVWVVVHRSGAGEDVGVNASSLAGETLSDARRRLWHRVYNPMPVLRCTFRDDAVSVRTVNANASLGAEVARIVEAAGAGAGTGVVLPDTCRAGTAADAGSGRRVRAFVVDGRARAAPPMNYDELVNALSIPGQTLALEDFAAVAHGAPDSGDVLLSASVADADATAVHWIHGASESDLLLSYPLPVEKYEDMNAKLKWLNSDPSWENTQHVEDAP